MGRFDGAGKAMPERRRQQNDYGLGFIHPFHSSLTGGL